MRFTIFLTFDSFKIQAKVHGFQRKKKHPLKKGTIIKSTGSWYTVKSDDGERIECKIKGNFRMKGIRSTNPVAVGDRVEFQWIENQSENSEEPIGIIVKIEERKNYIIRKSINLSKESHIIAANIDQAFLVATIEYPVTSTTFIDRFLVSAEAYRIPCILIFNKIDCYSEDQLKTMNDLISVYEKIGYRCIKTSALENVGIGKLAECMKNKTSVFSGHSGVGKSTIINAIEPNLKLRTEEISDYHKSGKHTTTFSEMFELSIGGFIVDTPGIKGFGMIEMEKEEISHYFPEMFLCLDQCQFYNCTHTHEPGCKVKEKVEQGEIALSRYFSYLGLLDNEEKYRI